MLGHKSRDQLELFITGSLQKLVPDDHVLARVDGVLDLGWLREEVAASYGADNGGPGIDLEVDVRLMLAGLLRGIVHDRRLLREARPMQPVGHEVEPQLLGHHPGPVHHLERQAAPPGDMLVVERPCSEVEVELDGLLASRQLWLRRDKNTLIFKDLEQIRPKFRSNVGLG